MELNIDLRGFETVYDLNLTARLFRTLEGELKRVHKATAEEFQCETKVEDEEDYSLLCSTLNGLEREAEHQEQSLRATEIIRLFVIFEGHLKDFCKVTQKQKQLSLGVSDFGGDLVEKAKRFLCDYAGIIGKGHSAWTPIGRLQQIRNHLVHSAVDQRSEAAKVELSKLAKSFQRFPLLVTGGELVLTREFCDHLHEAVTELFKALFDAVGWRTFRQ
jgi:hypothetical protein